MCMKNKAKSLLFAVLAAASLSLVAVGCKEEENEQTYSTIFADPALDAEVRALIGKPTGDLAVSDVDRVTRLEIDGYPIVRNLFGIENMTALRFLGLRSQGITDLIPLSALTNLDTLDLFGAPITDITPLASLTNLRFLSLSQSDVAELSPLAALSELRYLDLSDCWSLECEPLAGLHQMEVLHAGRTCMSGSVNWLSAMTNLRELDLSYSAVEDISSLSGLSGLEVCDIGNTRVTDIRPLNNHTGLRELKIGGLELSEYGPIWNFSELTSLYIARTALSDFAPLVGLSHLRQLTISHDQVPQVSPLEVLAELEDLRIVADHWRDTPVDLAHLTALIHLRQVIVLRAETRNIAALSTLNSLRYLTMSQCALPVYTELGQLVQLEVLNVDDCPPEWPLATLQPLSNLVNLRQLAMEDVGLLWGGGLELIPNLSRVTLAANHLSDCTPLSSLPTLNYLNLSGNAITETRPLWASQTLGEGDTVNLVGNPLSERAINHDIPQMLARGVEVSY